MEIKNTGNRWKVLVGLDLSEMDPELVRYIQTLETWLPLDHITFMHNVKLSELPEHLKNKEQLNRIAERVEQRLRNLIKTVYTPSVPIAVEVTLEEFSEVAFTEMAKKRNIDMVVLGNKQGLEGSGGLNQKLIRMLPVAVLLVPETVKAGPRCIIQAVDFSKYTQAVLQWGRHIESGSSGGNLRLMPVYVSKMSFHFFPSLSEEEIEKTAGTDASAKLKKWNEQFKGAPALEVVPAYEKSIATTLLDYAAGEKADMIIMGVKGATSLTNLFMGSVANEMVQRQMNLCLLLVKR